MMSSIQLPFQTKTKQIQKFTPKKLTKNINQNSQLQKEMLAQNLITFNQQTQGNQDDQIPPQRHIEVVYRNVLKEVTKIQLLKKFIVLENKTISTAQSIGTGKRISKKMRVKLINWLQKLSIETFQFSIHTLLLAIKLLDEYLCLTNQSPAQLQLIGCAALYLAAKQSEPVIVAAQCYVTASANCFSFEQLVSKQVEIYKTLNFNTTFATFYKVYNVFKLNQLVGNSLIVNKNDVDNLLVEIAKNLDFLEWKSHKIVSMIVAIVQVKKQLPDLAQLKEKLQSYSGC